MRSLRSLPSREAGFVEPMGCLAVTKLLDGPGWVSEIKLDGYRALATNTDGKLSLYSRRRKSFSRQYQHVFEALRDLPPNTVVDGKIVALAGAGRPNFNFLQHSRSQAKRICYFVFDLPIYDNRNLTHSPRMLCVRQRGGPCGRCGRFPDPFDAFPSNLVFRQRRPQRGSAGRLVRDH